MNIGNSLQTRRLSPPPRRNAEPKQTQAASLDTVEIAQQAQSADDGMNLTKTLGTAALLGVAVLGATGCVPQEPSAVETTVDTQSRSTDSINLDNGSSTETESTRSRTTFRSDGTISTDLGNGTKLRSDGTVGFDMGNGTTLNSDGTVDFEIGNGFSINSDGELNYNWGF